jgi:hypothetical protein
LTIEEPAQESESEPAEEGEKDKRHRCKKGEINVIIDGKLECLPKCPEGQHRLPNQRECVVKIFKRIRKKGTVKKASPIPSPIPSPIQGPIQGPIPSPIQGPIQGPTKKLNKTIKIKKAQIPIPTPPIPTPVSSPLAEKEEKEEKGKRVRCKNGKVNVIIDGVGECLPKCPEGQRRLENVRECSDIVLQKRGPKQKQI